MRCSVDALQTCRHDHRLCVVDRNEEVAKQTSLCFVLCVSLRFLLILSFGISRFCVATADDEHKVLKTETGSDDRCRQKERNVSEKR